MSSSSARTPSPRARLWLTISIIAMLIGMIGASLVQTSGGKVAVKDLQWETSPGIQMSGLLFVPDGVSAESPAPAVVVSHGMYNNREMQDLNFVELSRRGYVVLSMDMYSHGKSEPVSDIGTVPTGMYEAVSMLAGLDYVDSSRIGITGHSLGGMSSNAAVGIENEVGTDYISAVLINSADAVYADEDGNWVNIYGSRDVGIIAGKYDEWFFQDVDENGNTTATRDFLKYNNAQSFLNFGQDPSAAETRVAETVYTETIDGEEAMRVIYNPTIIHPWSHFSKQSTNATIDFFNEALTVEDALPGTSQVWQWKVVFNTIGLIGFGIFIVAFPIMMLGTRTFAPLRSPSRVAIRETDRAGLTWFWGTSALVAAFATIVYVPILLGVKSNTFSAEPWAQSSPWGIGMWAVTVGLFIAVVLAVFYFAYGKKVGINLAERGVTMPWGRAGRTLLLSATTAAAAFAWVFIADYFFKTDFRIWTLAAKAFPARTLWVSLFPTLVLITVFFVMASIATNSINFIKLTARSKEWVNTAVIAAFNVLPAVVLLAIQYLYFTSTGFIKLPNMQTVWLFPLLVFLPVSTIISRKIYRETNNPYLGGLINALIVTFMSTANTLTWAV